MVIIRISSLLCFGQGSVNSGIDGYYHGILVENFWLSFVCRKVVRWFDPLLLVSVGCTTRLVFSRLILRSHVDMIACANTVYNSSKFLSLKFQSPRLHIFWDNWHTVDQSRIEYRFSIEYLSNKQRGSKPSICRGCIYKSSAPYHFERWSDW